MTSSMSPGAVTVTEGDTKVTTFSLYDQDKYLLYNIPKGKEEIVLTPRCPAITPRNGMCTLTAKNDNMGTYTVTHTNIARTTGGAE